MELADDIETRLAAYLQDPLVLVTVGSGLGDPGQQIPIVGEAAEPTALAYRSGMSVLAAVLGARSEEHTSALQSLMRIPYAAFCLKKKHLMPPTHHIHHEQN